MKRLLSVFTIFLCLVFALPLQSMAAGQNVLIVGGAQQKVQVGRKAPKPAVFKVVNRRGAPVKTIVEFSVVKGSGSMSAKKVKTGANGIAKVYFTAGFKAGRTVLKAQVPGGVYRTIDFTVTLDNPNKKKPAKKPAKKPVKKPSPVKPKPVKKPSPVKPKPVKKPVAPSGKAPSIIIGFAGSGQTIEPGQLGRSPLEVQVMDDKGNVLPGVKVNFKVIKGQAFLMPGSDVSDKKGIAGVKVRVGEDEGSVQVKATTVGNDDLATIFNITVTPKKDVSITPRPTRTPVYTPRPTRTPVYHPRPNPTPVVRLTPVPRPVYTPTPEPTPDYSSVKIPKPTPRVHGQYTRDPKNVSVVGGNYQSSRPGTRLSAPLVVYVTDEDGNPTEATVQFTIIGGDAKVTSRQVRTDQRGLASTFIIVNSPNQIRIVAEVLESPGLSTIAYANARKPGTGNGSGDNNPLIKTTHPTNQPGFPAAIAFYSMRSQNTDAIEKTGVVQLEIGVTDFRNQPVATPVRFSVVKGKVAILNPVVQTNAKGRGICYVDLGSSMGIFTVEAQSLENPDLKAVFRSGPQIRSGPATEVVRPGFKPDSSKHGNGSFSVPPPSGSNPGGTPALIAVISGGGQSGKVGSRLPEPLEILVTDSKGMPVADTMVSFIVFRGQARLEKRFARTNSSGKVTNSVVLGKRPGPIEIAVRLRDNKSLRTTIQLNAER